MKNEITISNRKESYERLKSKLNERENEIFLILLNSELNDRKSGREIMGLTALQIEMAATMRINAVHGRLNGLMDKGIVIPFKSIKNHKTNNQNTVYKIIQSLPIDIKKVDYRMKKKLKKAKLIYDNLLKNGIMFTNGLLEHEILNIMVKSL